MAVVVGAEMPGSGVEKALKRGGASSERTAAPELGVSVAHPEAWRVEREQYTYDGTRGFTLWKTGGEAVEDHGGTPAARVALAPGLDRGKIEEKVRQRIADHPELELTRKRVIVGESKLKGVAVGPIPGSTPFVEVYVPVKNRVYQINVYGVELGAEGTDLLESLKFDTPTKSRSILSSGLPSADDPRTFYQKDANTAKLTKSEQAAREESYSSSPGEVTRSTSLIARDVPVYGEKSLYEGCWLAASKFFVQTQHGYGANGFANDPGTDAPKGFAPVGIPNFWGQYTHGSIGYGRCASPYYTNDKFAVDYPLNAGDVVFSPFASGTVTFAGRNNTHKNYGIFVIIEDDNGKYVSMSAHLNGLAPGIRRGARVYKGTVIGYAGNTGADIAVGQVHLHQAFYRYPRFNADGSPYAGRGLQVLYHHYTGYNRNVRAGVYRFAWQGSDTISTKTEGELVGN